MPTAAKVSQRTMDFYRKLLEEGGVPLYEGQHGSDGKADRIVLAHTQGFMPEVPEDISLRQDPRYPEADEDTGGQTLYVLGTARAFADVLGRRVTILAQRFSPESPPLLRWHNNVDIVRIPPEGIDNHKPDFPFTRKVDLYPKIRNMSADAVAVSQLVGAQAVIGNYADGGMVALELAEQLNIPMVFIAHSLGLEKMDKEGHDHSSPAAYHTSNLWFAHRLWVELASIRGSDYVISNSPNEKSSFVERYGIDVPRQKFMPGGVGELYYDVQKAMPSMDMLRKHPEFAPHNLQPGKFFISWQRISETKNIPGQIEVLAHLKQMFPEEYRDYKVVIIGWNNVIKENSKEYCIKEMVDQMERHYIEAGILKPGDVVRITKKLPSEIAQIAPFAAAYLGLQNFEPFGMAPAENLAMGRSITVVSRKAGIAEWIKHNWDGVLVDPADTRDAARMIHNALSKPSMRRDIVDHGKILAAQFTWEGIARQQADILDGLVASGSVYTGRALHRSAPVWYGVESTIDEDYKEGVEQMSDKFLAQLIEDGLDKLGNQRLFISVSGQEGRQVADYLSTTLLTRGFKQQRLPAEVLNLAKMGDLAALKDKDNKRHFIGGAAIDLEDIDVIIADVEAGHRSEVARAGDIAISAGTDITAKYYGANLNIHGANVAMVSSPVFQPMAAILGR